MSQSVVITGGGRGIGAAIARAFHAAGARVFICSRSDTGLAGSLGKTATFVAGDVRERGAHARFARAAVESAGRLDGWINCAGISRWRAAVDVDEAFWNEIIDTNLKGAFWGCSEAARRLTRGGWIVNISSLAGKRGSANNSVYCASKFGVNGLTQALAKELGPSGIRVNAVCPVYVETEGLEKALGEPVSPAGGAGTGTYLREFAEQNAALRRLPTGDEIAHTCLFLASEQASAITGQCINVDCGVLPQ